MNLCIAGEGAIARHHLDALARLDEVNVVCLAGFDPGETARLVSDRAIPSWTLDLNEALNRSDVDAVLLATPTGLHASQAINVMEADKHVLIEIPMADSLRNAEAVVAAQERTGVTAMVCHTRRFNPPHQWIHRRIENGELALQHLVAVTLFFRRDNVNLLGKPRMWTDHLLWHHACHVIDLFGFQTGEDLDIAWAQQGPIHPQFGIATDMTIALRSRTSRALCSIAISFNNEGPLGTTFRYICDNGTYVAGADSMVDGNDQPVPLTGVTEGSGMTLQDREFVDAVRTGREPRTSVRRCLPTMQTISELDRLLRHP